MGWFQDDSSASHFSSVQFSCSVVSDSSTPWTAARQASLSITNSWSLLKLMSMELVMPSNHLIHGITYTVHFISIIMTSVPPQITRHQIPEVGDPYPTGSSPGPCTSWCHPDRACLTGGIWDRGGWTNNHG